MARHRGRLVRLIEAAYQPRDSLHAWMDALTARTAELVGESEGAIGRLVSLEPRRALGYSIHIRDPEVAEITRAYERVSSHRVDVVTHGPPIGLRRLHADAKNADDPTLVAMRERFAGTGIADMVHLTAFDASDTCLTIGMLVRDGVSVRGGVESWARVGVHLAAALRLQHHLLQLAEELPPDGAVLEPDGRVVDADGEAREARALLREEARRIDAARASASRDGSGRALEVWRGLIDGTWSLVDRHDHDGRRYLVAVPNRAAPRDPRGLSSRVAQVAALAAAGYSDKWIAYTLGLERSTVATHLQSALEKLGLASRVSLAGAFGPTERNAEAEACAPRR